MPRAGADWQPLPSQRPARDANADEVFRLREELEKARQDVVEANRKRRDAERRTRTLEDEAEEQRRKVGKMPRATLDRKASEICERWCDQYDVEQIAELAMAVVFKAQKHHKTCMADQVRRSAIFKKMLPGITRRATSRSPRTSASRFSRPAAARSSASWPTTRSARPT